VDGAGRQEALNRIGAASLAIVLAASAALPAQDDLPAATLTGQALLGRLRADDLPIAEAGTLAAQLVAEPIAIRLPASDALRDAFLRRGKQHGKRTVELQKALAKAAGALVTEQLGKQGLAEVDQRRSAALAISRSDGLTKERIQAELDPCVEWLTARLWPTREQFAAKDPAIATHWTALQSERAELAAWFAAYVESTVGLDLHPQAQKHFTKNPPPPAPAPVAALEDEWIVWTMLAAPLSARDRKTLEQNELLRAHADPEEFAGTTALNRLRFLLGLPLVRIDDKLTQAARDHSQDMVSLGFFDHTSPVPGKRTPGDRAARFGTSGGAENIAVGQERGAGAIRAWWYSPGHHRNMLGGHARTGLGRSEQTWTQMFGG